MGWLWATPSPSKPSTPAPNESTSSAPPPSTHAAPNEPVDPEIQKFFELFAAESEAATKQTRSSESKTTNTDTSKSSTSSPSWFSLHAPKASSADRTPTPDAPTRDALSESLLPTEMSCRQAFDLAWACNGIGGQWNAVYRYGTMRSCSEQWDDFWFCMRTKSYTGEVKDNMVKARYRNKDHARYGDGKPNSEDVWEIRSQKLPSGSAFTEKVEIPEVSDEEWREMENERRRQIRHGLEFDKSTS